MEIKYIVSYLDDKIINPSDRLPIMLFATTDNELKKILRDIFVELNPEQVYVSIILDGYGDFCTNQDKLIYDRSQPEFCMDKVLTPEQYLSSIKSYFQIK